MEEKDGYLLSKDCACAIKKRIERLIERAGISEAFKACTFDGFEDWNDSAKEAKRCAMDYAEAYEQNKNQSTGNSLLLMGNVGSGKTMLGVCVLNALVNRGISVFYAPFRDMVLNLKGNVTDDEEYNRALEKYTNPKVLFLDDLYKGATANDPKYVYDVVNARYLARRPMIVTSEFNADAILQIDEAVGSRILQMSKGFAYELRGDGLNYRLRGL